MMSGVSLETCSAIKKHWNNKFYYTVASCWLFLYELPWFLLPLSVCYRYTDDSLLDLRLRIPLANI